MAYLDHWSSCWISEQVQTVCRCSSSRACCCDSAAAWSVGYWTQVWVMSLVYDKIQSLRTLENICTQVVKTVDKKIFCRCMLHLPGWRLNPGRVWHRTLDVLQVSQDGLRLVRDLLLVRGGRDVDKLGTLPGELVLGVQWEGLGLGHFLGDPLDADILVESHLARLGYTRVFGPQRWRSLHLHNTNYEVWSFKYTFATLE